MRNQETVAEPQTKEAPQATFSHSPAPPDQRIQEAAERFGPFLCREVNPGTLERDRTAAHLPETLLRQACKLGLTPYFLPREIGGHGADAQVWGGVLEQVGYLCEDLSFPLVVSLRASVIKTLYDSGRSDLVERYVLPMVAGELAPAFAYTDGTDPFSFRTRALPTTGGYALSGTKWFTTGGQSAHVFMTYARVERDGCNDLAVFLVERDDPGVKVEPVDVAGYRAAGIATLHLEDVRVPEDRVLVTADGLSHVQLFLNSRRVHIVCPVLGRMQAVLESTIRSLDQTLRYGKPLTAMQHVQAEIGRMYGLVETTRAIVYRALEQQAQGEFDPLWDPTGALAKSYAVDRGIELIHIAQRLLGGSAYLRARHYERYLRDFCGLIPGAGSQGTLDIDLGVAAISRTTR